MLRQIHIDKIDQEMHQHQSFDVTVFDVIHAENDAYQKSKDQFVQTAVFIVQRREQQRGCDDRNNRVLESLFKPGKDVSPENKLLGNAYR